MNPGEIIQELYEDGAETKKAMIDALSDGAYLSTKEWSQLEVECTHNLLKEGEKCEAYEYPIESE